MTELGEGVGVASSPEDDEPGDEPEGALLRITDIRGLYSPGYDDGAVPRPMGAGDCPGYVSHDDLGRVFINHRPRPTPTHDWDVRASNIQYIELTATLLPSRGTIPPDAKVRWTYFDADDPSDALMHTAAARLIDPNREQLGDNRGRCDYPREDAGPPAYEAIGYAMSNEHNQSCETEVIDNRSRVRLHLTNVGGDNFRVRAELVGVDGAAHETGLITMWKRLDVAYYSMRGDIPRLPIREVAREYEICYVQLDFTEPRFIDYQEHLCADERYDIVADQVMDREFAERRQPGWFCLFAMDLETSVLSTDPSRTVYTGSARIEHGADSSGVMRDWLVISSPGVEAANFDFVNWLELTQARGGYLTDGTGEPLFFAFLPPGARDNWPDANSVSFPLRGLDYNSDFEANAGEYDQAYDESQRTWLYPSRTRRGSAESGQWVEDGGLGFGATVEAELRAGTTIGARGITPLRYIGQRGYFAGRTMVFTGRFRMTYDGPPRGMPFDRARCTRTIVHELAHAFGMPHSCGYHSYDESADACCAMAILGRWLWRPGTRELRRNYEGRLVPHLCARHILEIRKTHLEDNLALWDW